MSDSFIEVGARIRTVAPVRAWSGTTIPQRRACVVTSVLERAPAQRCPDHQNYPFCTCGCDSGVVPERRRHAVVEWRTGGKAISGAVFPEDEGVMWERLVRHVSRGRLSLRRTLPTGRHELTFLLHGRGPDLAVAELRLEDGTRICVMRQTCLPHGRGSKKRRSTRSAVVDAVRRTLALVLSRLDTDEATPDSVLTHQLRVVLDDPLPLRRAREISFRFVGAGWLDLVSGNGSVI